MLRSQNLHPSGRVLQIIILLLHDCVVIIGSIGFALLGTMRLFQSFCKRKVISKVHHNFIANLQRSRQKNLARLESCSRQFDFRLTSYFLSCPLSKKINGLSRWKPLLLSAVFFFCFVFYQICLFVVLCQSFSTTPEVSKDWGSLVEEEEEKEARLQKKEMANPR